VSDDDRRSLVFKRILNLWGNKRFILNDEDDAPDERTFHGVAFLARLSATARGRAACLMTAADVSRASINPLTRKQAR